MNILFFHFYMLSRIGLLHLHRVAYIGLHVGTGPTCQSSRVSYDW